MDVFLATESERLRSLGFDPDQALAVTATCRDEILAPLRAGVRSHWHRAFDFSSLSGLPLAGVTGAAAVLDHTPQTGQRTQVVVFALPHIGVLSDGTVGQAMRRGRTTPTAACGSLVAAQRWAGETGSLSMDALSIDPDDPEQSLVRQRLIREVPTLAGADLMVVTRRVRELMLRDIVELVDRVADPEATDVAVVSGVLVHATDGDVVEAAPTWLRIAGAEQTASDGGRLPGQLVVDGEALPVSAPEPEVELQ